MNTESELRIALAKANQERDEWRRRAEEATTSLTDADDKARVLRDERDLYRTRYEGVRVLWRAAIRKMEGT